MERRSFLALSIEDKRELMGYPPIEEWEAMYRRDLETWRRQIAVREFICLPCSDMTVH